MVGVRVGAVVGAVVGTAVVLVEFEVELDGILELPVLRLLGNAVGVGV